MSNILSVNKITVKYGKAIAVNEISFAVPEGRIVTLIGANGAGKSTTLNSLLGLVPLAAGSISFREENITGMQTQDIVRKGLVLVPEGRHLFPFLSVYDNLQLGATQRKDRMGIKRDLEFVYELFPKLKVRKKQAAGTLSGGEQQMLAIARGLMAAPKLLCLDEPSLGLAPLVIEQLGKAIKQINETGVSILLVEQNVNLAFGIADYCYALAVGKLIAEGDVATISRSGKVREAYFGNDSTEQRK